MSVIWLMNWPGSTPETGGLSSPIPRSHRPSFADRLERLYTPKTFSQISHMAIDQPSPTPTMPLKLFKTQYPRRPSPLSRISTITRTRRKRTPPVSPQFQSASIESNSTSLAPLMNMNTHSTKNIRLCIFVPPSTTKTNSSLLVPISNYCSPQPVRSIGSRGPVPYPLTEIISRCRMFQAENSFICSA